MRQSFNKGQTVYCHNYSGQYRKAVVKRPDFTTKSSSSGAGSQRDIHYVGVQYVNQQGEAESNEWPVLNNRRQIITEEAFNEINRAKSVRRLRQDIAAYASFEVSFMLYFDQAEIICRTLRDDGRNGEPSEINELAHYLRGMFGFLSSYQQLDREGVRVLRHGKRCKAADAHAELQAMGEEVPELAKEAGA